MMTNCPYCHVLLPWQGGQCPQSPNYQTPNYRASNYPAQRDYQEPEEERSGRNTGLLAILLIVFIVILGGAIVFAVNNYSNSNQLSMDKAASTQQSSKAKPGTSDTSAPVISDVEVTSITKTSAVITWSTDKPSSSQVNYGISTERDFSTTIDKNLVTRHSVTIQYLKPATNYHFIVRSADEKGNEALSDDSTFKTLVSDTAPGNEF